MLAAHAKHPNCAYMWLRYISSPKVQAQQAVSYGETPANKLACPYMDKIQAVSCAKYHANAPASYFNSIKFWKTPTTKCDNGQTDCTAAFRAAIEACSRAGGGRVMVPAGRFLTGPIHLRSHVNLHVTRDATIAFTTDTKAYLPQVLTRFESTELMNYSPFIYALDQENIAVTGEGTLDGQASDENWWSWKGQRGKTEGTQVPARNRLVEMAEKNETFYGRFPPKKVAA